MVDDPEILKQVEWFYTESPHLKIRHLVGQIEDGKGGWVSATTLKAIRKLEFRSVSITPRPRIVDEKHAAAALEDALFIRDDMCFLLTCDVDEKYFYVPGWGGSLTVKKGEAAPPHIQFKPCGHKKHLPKIMVLCIIAQPQRSLDGASWLTDGKVAIARVSEPVQRKRGVISGYEERRSKKDPAKTVRVPVYSAQKGDVVHIDTTLDGPGYRRIMTPLLSTIAAYFEATLALFRARSWTRTAPSITIQHDGAPGHGYNNHKFPPEPTKELEALMTEASKKGIVFRKQAGHCPSHNALDQSVWHSLAAAVNLRAREFEVQMTKTDLLDKLWAVIQEEWAAMDPEIIDDCFWDKREAAEATIREKGWTKQKQEHSGVRKAKAEFLASKGWARIPHEAPKVVRELAEREDRPRYYCLSSESDTDSADSE